MDGSLKSKHEDSACGNGVDLGLLPGLLGYNLRRAQERMFVDFSGSMAPWRITPGQMGVLVIVRANAGMNQQRLAEALEVDRSTMSAVLDGLEGRGLIARKPSPRDRRSHALEITAGGLKVLDELAPAHREHEARIAERLSATERRQLIGLLQKLNGG